MSLYRQIEWHPTHSQATPFSQIGEFVYISLDDITAYGIHGAFTNATGHVPQRIIFIDQSNYYDGEGHLAFPLDEDDVHEDHYTDPEAKEFVSLARQEGCRVCHVRLTQWVYEGPAVSCHTKEDADALVKILELPGIVVQKHETQSAKSAFVPPTVLYVLRLSKDALLHVR